MGLIICVVCDECREELVVNPVFDTTQPGCDITVYPKPCPTCLKKEKGKSYQEGHLDGKGDGVDEYLGRT